MDCHLDLDITPVVLDEQRPLVRGVGRMISSLSPIGDRGIAGDAEVPDQILALGELLFLKTQHSTHSHERQGQPEVGGPDHRAAPGSRVQVGAGGKSQIAGEADTFEGGVERPLHHAGIGERFENLLGYLFPPG
ncbi:hypothetical protein SDC9_210193 [bioreactor metagenome]|uniref:Uncharacterized protein n=1 Tax=bioreactor metagenome TaxID=1076179 RepID=A0A645JFH3_9ZZZZ